MMKNKSYLLLILGIAIPLSVSSCAKAKTSTAAAAASTTSTTTTTTTTSTVVTIASLDGGSTAAWMSSCIALTPLVSGSTATYHQYVLIFSGANYFFYDNWFNNSSCTVVSGELFYLSSSGAYTIGSIASGTLYNIQFTASGASIYPLSYVSSGTAAASWLTSTGCSAAGTFAAGTQKSTSGDDCGVSEMPASNEVSNNVIQLSGSNITIGAPSLYYVTPGVFSSALAGDKDGGATQSTPSTATVLLVPCSGSVCGVD